VPKCPRVYKDDAIVLIRIDWRHFERVLKARPDRFTELQDLGEWNKTSPAKARSTAATTLIDSRTLSSMAAAHLGDGVCSECRDTARQPLMIYLGKMLQ
jgi:hypothetical protein